MVFVCMTSVVCLVIVVTHFAIVSFTKVGRSFRLDVLRDDVFKRKER
jgi:hypothetical protein